MARAVGFVILFLSLFATGYAIRCYSCTAKYGSRETDKGPVGPCWNWNAMFNASAVSTVECEKYCLWKEGWSNYDPVLGFVSNVTTVTRGCGTKDDWSCAVGSIQKDAASTYNCCQGDLCNNDSGRPMTWIIDLLEQRFL